MVRRTSEDVSRRWASDCGDEGVFAVQLCPICRGKFRWVHRNRRMPPKCPSSRSMDGLKGPFWGGPSSDGVAALCGAI